MRLILLIGQNHSLGVQSGQAQYECGVTVELISRRAAIELRRPGPEVELALSENEGLQVVEQNPYTYQGQIQPDVVPLHILGAKYGDDNLLPAYPERRICGVRARIFWTIFGVAMFLIVVAAAVGGGIGGSRAAQHAKEATEADLARYVPF